VTLEDGTTVKGVSSFLDEGFYNSITSQLDVEKTEANGYYILIVLSIGMMVLSQFIAMRSQKEANQYQTVDGSGASQQKMMMIIMPLIYCLFAFMYSAAFSIYMTMSSFITIIVTLLCNLIIGKIFNKKEEEALIEKYTRTAPKRPASGNNTKTNQKGRK
jgi:membrane protein insertase Oxa1/YidC/SpoIIIJ